MIKKRYWISAGLVICLTAYLLWPLASERFRIRHDRKLVDRKNDYLTTLEELSRSDSSRLPNIVIIMADDLGLTDISFYGSELVHTQHIDQLANQGVAFTRAYVTSPVCSPSRAGFLTGRYQQRFGFENQMQERYLKNRLEYYGMSLFINSKPWTIHEMAEVPTEEDIFRQGLPPSEISLAEVLRARGYATALVGKWHLGRSPGSLPCDFGFDHHYGFYGSHSLYAPENDPRIVSQKIEGDWTDPYIWAGQREGSHAINRNCQAVEESEYLTTRFAQESVQFIQQNAQNPFFLFASFSAPHTPLQVPEEYYQRFSSIEDPVKRAYNAMIASLDDAVGDIMKELDQQGLAENTLVFFLSDNGGATYTLTTDNAPYKGGKITSFEGGLRVPFFARWPGKIPAGIRFDPSVSSLDIFATVCSVAGIDLPGDRVYDGVDLVPFVLAEEPEEPHSRLFWKRGAVRTILAQGWKLVFDSKYGQTLLYNLQTDSLERNNLVDQQPNVVDDLKEIHHEWHSQMPTPLWPPLITFEFTEGDQTYYFDN